MITAPTPTATLVRRMLAARLGTDPGTLNFLFPLLRFMDPVTSPDRIAASWSRACAGATPATLYVHVPFCTQHCRFCAFATTYAQQYDRVLAYLDDLEREIDGWSRRIDLSALKVQALFIGGGTPNYLRAREMERLLAALNGMGCIEPGAEWSVEMYPKPEMVSDLLAVMKDGGVTRISHCAQDFNDDVLTATGRTYKASEALSVGACLREAGFTDMNIDLMVGMPSQSAAGAVANIAALRELEPTHVTLNPFSTRSPGIPWARPAFAGILLPQDTIRAQYDAYREWLEAHGYRRVNKTNFERQGSKPFLYEALVRQSRPRLGLGLGALGFTGHATYRNAGTLATYGAKVRDEGLAVEAAYDLAGADAERARLFYSALSGTLDAAALARTAGDEDAADVGEVVGVLREHGLVTQDGPDVRLTRDGEWNVGLVQRAFLPPRVLESRWGSQESTGDRS